MAFAGALVALVSAQGVRANGAFPDEFSIHFPAPYPRRILLGANFGLLVSDDEGATWRYACEPWITAGSSAALSDSSVSFYQLTADGAVIALSQEMTRSQDAACNWPPSSGSITGQVVTDFFPDPNDASFVMAIVINSATVTSHLVASHDGGKTFDAPKLYSTSELLTGIEIARSTPGIVYATKVALSGPGSTLLRSADKGSNWTATDIGAPAGTQPRILAIDPQDAKTVYLRVVGGLSDSIVITTDGGATFWTILDIRGQFSSFLRAGDGSLYAGTIAGQLYVRRPGATEFSVRAGPHLRCLGQRPGNSRVYACGDMGVDGFSLGFSDDGGDTFKSMMAFSDLQGPLTCAPVQTACAAHWDRIQTVLGMKGTDAGTVDGGTQDGGAIDAGTGSDGAPQTGRPGSCASAGAGAGSIVALIALLLRRRRPRP
jgi:hypothetical protein